MDPIRIYDYLTLARGRMFDHIRPLSDAQYTQAFPIGLGTLGRTLTHIMICEWFYVQRLEQRIVPPYAEWPIQDEHPPPFSVLESTWTEQAKQTRASLEAVRDWNAPIEYRSTYGSDESSPMIVTASIADLFTQLALHEMHHRAQALSMLRGLGVAVGDLDFNSLMYTRRPAPD